MRLLSIYKHIYEKQRKAVLMIVGDGELKDDIEYFVSENDISESVIVLGQRNDVGSLMMAMDVFVLPSLYEGLGLVLVEAQASGLSCIKSTVIPVEVDITDRIQSVSLDETDERWAETILNIRQCDRAMVKEQIQKSGYDIQLETKKLQAFYIGEAEKTIKK